MKTMIKHALILLFFPVLLHAQGIQRVGDLFDSLKTHPVFISDEIQIKQALAGKTLAYSKLYPNIDLFGRYDYSSSANAMLPLPLDELFAYKADPSRPQPFSENIYRLGATISMPIFVASIFPIAAKAKMMVRSAEDQKNINLLKNEAVIVGADANLLYMQALDQALVKKKNSLLKTKEFVVIKVNNGRAPESTLLNISNGISQIDILKNDLALKREEVAAVIQSLTGVVLKIPLNMDQIGNYKDGELKALDPLRKKVEADRLGFKAEKENLLPSLVLQGSYSNNSAKSYNNDQHVNNDYTTIGAILKVPLFAKDQYARIRKSRLDFEASKNDLERTSLELASQAAQMQNSLILIANSIQLYNNSIKEKEQLLDIAKVSYQSDRLSMEDYLKYEDDVVLEQSKLFKAQAEKWQTLVKLCVIYGNNIEEIVK
jgi:outer membrane protein TolC